MVSVTKFGGSAPVVDVPQNAEAGSGVSLQCAGVSKRYGDVQAVLELHLTAKAGQILALLGPSGCGKTTTLRLIAGFEQPDDGEISIGSRVVSSPTSSVPPERRRIGMVFQEGALFPHLTVEQNVGYGLRREQGRAGRIEDALALVGLSSMRKRMPHELSCCWTNPFPTWTPSCRNSCGAMWPRFCAPAVSPPYSLLTTRRRRSTWETLSL